MKAFAITAKRTIRELEINEPVLNSNDVLLEVHYIGLCGSDLNAYRGLMPLVTFPRIPGHEISGIIIDKGDRVPDSFKKGAKATISPYTNCGLCPACRAGRFNTCEYNQTLGVQRDGALTKLICVPYDKVYPNDKLSLKELALVEPLSVGYHGVNRGQVRETDTVLLIGCGTIGMGALMAVVRKGATVIALDIDDNKLDMARDFGAAYVINSKVEDAHSKIMELTNSEGVNVAIEAAGNPDTLVLALEAVSFAGTVVSIGYSKEEVHFNSQLIVRKELNVYGSRNALRVFPSVIQMFERKEKPYLNLISKIYPFEQSHGAFKYWDENPGLVTKILIDVKG
ncbi:MAG: zinc-binding alcohol dehydrogenase family protein [Bacteroidales bacterium]|nr:zinc-binding alcohol dehydrogenase family protein [Bacteroidales bacterium]